MGSGTMNRSSHDASHSKLESLHMHSWCNFRIHEDGVQIPVVWQHGQCMWPGTGEVHDFWELLLMTCDMYVGLRGELMYSSSRGKTMRRLVPSRHPFLLHHRLLLA